MLDALQSPLAQSIGRRKPNHTLEVPFYTSPEIFRTDLDMIFGRHWIYVAVEPDVPEPGDALVVDIGPSSVLIGRDEDMRVVSFRNVCRHRGAIGAGEHAAQADRAQAGAGADGVVQPVGHRAAGHPLHRDRHRFDRVGKQEIV